MIFRATINMLFYGQVCQNVLHFDKPDAVFATDGPALADSIDSTWIANVKVPVAADVNFYQVRIDDAEQDSGAPTHTKAVVQSGGGGFDTQCPLNVAWVLIYSTGLSGKHFHGRTFVPGLRPGYTNSGLINATGLALWPTRITNLKSAYVGASPSSGFHLCLYNERNRAFGSTRVADIQIRTTPGSMRKRMLGVGQ